MSGAEIPIIASVAGGVLGPMLFGPKDTPSYQSPGAPNVFPEYQKKLLNAGFNRNDALYEAAFRNQSNTVNRELAKRGVAKGGYGAGVQMQAATDLSNKMTENELDRMQRSYTAAVNPEMAAYQARQKDAEMKYKTDMADYERRSSAASGLGSAFGGMMGYGASQGWFKSGTPGVSPYQSTLSMNDPNFNPIG